MTFIQRSAITEHRPVEDQLGSVSNLITKSSSTVERKYRDLLIRDNREEKTFWCFMRQTGIASYTHEIMEEFKQVETTLGERCNEPALEQSSLQWFVMASATPGIFSYGGDLRHFAEKIRTGDHEALRCYGHAAVRAVYRNTVAFDLPLVTIALVQGDALGGGFEHALSFDMIVAERGTKFGLPEVMFNMIPGMGAYSFLSRRLDRKRAEAFITSGAVRTAEELFEMGIVDILAEPGKGEQAVRTFIARTGRKHNSLFATMQARRRVNPVTLDELMDVVDIWADAAMRLTATDLRGMARLIAAQDRRIVPAVYNKTPVCD